MLKRTLVFSSPCHLKVKLGQLCFCPAEEGQAERSVSIEDVAIVLLENSSITLSLQLLQRLVDNGAAVVVCDGCHMPLGLLQPLEGNTTHAETLRLQIEAKLPSKKRLWQQIVRKKIENQAALLEERGCPMFKTLQSLSASVKSDDADNREAVAARVYWQNLFSPPGFTREREGRAPNNLLNYGYAVLRAATARALAGSGFHCAIGLHHRNRYNAFSLVDDIMEPYRPFVDRIVCRLHSETDDPNLSPQIKAALLEVLTTDTHFADKRRPLMVALSLTTASLSRCLRGEDAQMAYPSMG